MRLQKELWIPMHRESYNEIDKRDDDSLYHYLRAHITLMIERAV